MKMCDEMIKLRKNLMRLALHGKIIVTLRLRMLSKNWCILVMKDNIVM